MSDIANNEHGVLNSELKEREKELNCLYKVDEILVNNQLSLPEILNEIIRVIPSGWKFPEFCRVKIVFNNQSYQSLGFIASSISEKCNIKADGKIVGNIEVVYIEDVPKSKDGYFLEKELQLIKAIAERIGQMILYRQMKSVMNEWELSKLQKGETSENRNEWEIIINFFYHNDHSMLLHICRKMINYLLINGINEAYEVLNNSTISKALDTGYANYPTLMKPIEDVIGISKRTFKVAKKHLSNREITMHIKRWIKEENAYSLVRAICCVSPSLRNIIDELNRYSKIIREENSFYSPQERWLNVSLISYILSDKPEFVATAKKYINYRDFFDIINKIILPINSQGKIGGKGVGLFFAQKILEKEIENLPQLKNVKIPNTWYITTDAITEFLKHNNLEELNEQKYKELYEVRIEYPNIVQLMKNSKLPSEIEKSLSVALDDFGDVPIIVRSSSMLEDQAGTAFSGKYKSLFLANQGNKKERLEALKDAVIEVYASIFSPDPIQYRKERKLLDIHEEMGILIQEVVGEKIGNYYFPYFSGVAFSNNEYRWSPRIKREDGLLRIVPGLGTRAVDRLSDDFPVLISPESPEIRVNIVPEEIKKYSPKKMDVINLERKSFETIEIGALLREYGNEMEIINKIVSIYEYNNMRRPNKYEIDFQKDDLVVTFDGIVAESNFIKQISSILKVLKEKIGLPVDIEYAHDGKHLYLLQCRPQSSSVDSAPAAIPKDINKRDLIFSANKYISNGEINNIAYIVYVDPIEYDKLDNIEKLNNVGKAVGRLNSMLPRRQFVLIGPGRWGSRGDIKLGVSVNYSDICNTAALLEVAVNKTGYLPELSFGTHFFQDLVEADIRYLPLYPDDNDIIFNSTFLSKSKNVLKDILPEYQELQDVIKVIDIPETSGGKIFRIAMNAELEEAVGFLTDYKVKTHNRSTTINYDELNFGEQYISDNSWKWRFHMAERLAAMLDAESFGIKGMYLFGSTNNGTAGPGSDIDLLVHFKGTEKQKIQLLNWFDGWSLSLDEMNYLKTGYRMGGLLDIHIITDEDIENKTCFASKIDSFTDPAYRLKLKLQE